MQQRINDIRVYKAELRQQYKSIRNNMTENERAAADSAILNRLQTLRSYKYAKTVLCSVVVTDKQLIFANRAKRQKPSHFMRKDGNPNGRK